MKFLLRYLNPIDQFGKKTYSFWFPTLTTISAAVLLEFAVYKGVLDKESVGLFAIFVFIAFIIYFAFRDGILGGFSSTIITIGYYFYIIFTREYSGDQLVTSIETTIILAVLYFFLSGTIGWLKQTIDGLIRRESDEKHRLQTIIEQLPVGVIITDTSGQIINANQQINEILGMKIPEGHTFGKKTLLTSTYKGKPADPTDTPLMRALKQGVTVVGEEFTIQRKDNSEAHVHVSASPIHNMQGETIAAASIISDITHQKELEKRKDDFVNIASHELKTPLTSLKLYVDVLLRRLGNDKDEKLQKIIHNLKMQTDRLQKLVNDLLDVSRIQTGKLTFEIEHFDLHALILETVEVLQATTETRLEYNENKSILVTGDRFRIYQVLTNLITNAIKYSPDGKKIIIKTQKKQERVIVSVQDFGVGIAKDQQSKIFERLYQVPDIKDKSLSGFGMGLYISKEIITRHKGEIWVESAKGKGSTFYFTLPCDTLS